MAFNIRDDKDITRLRSAVDWSILRMQPFKQHRYDFIAQFAGYNYGDAESRTGDHNKRIPLNYLELAISIYLRYLITENPQFHLSTDNRESKAVAYKCQNYINKLSKKMQLRNAIREAVTESMFSMGAMKIGVDRTGWASYNDFNFDVGELYAESISFDDLVLDMTVKKLSNAAFIGNIYTMPYEYLMDSKEIKRGAKDFIKPDSLNPNGFGELNAASIGRSNDSNPQSMYDHTRLLDLYLYKENLLTTSVFSPQGGTLHVIKEIDWTGPEEGPYLTLSLGDIPDNIIPRPPAALLYDLNLIINMIYRKAARQAENTKDVIGYKNSANDANRIAAANDLDIIRIDERDSVEEFKFGGVNPQNFAFMIQSAQLYNEQAGNLQSLGGLSPQSETLGQERLLAASASKRINDYQDKVTTFTQKIGEAMFYWVTTDPLLDESINIQIPDTKIEVQTRLRSEELENRISDMKIEVVPYSLTSLPPAQRIMIIDRLVQELAPILPLAMQQGVMIDIPSWVKMKAEMLNIPEINDVIKINPMPPQEGTGPSHERTSAPVTTRENVRVNRPGTTQFGQQQAMINTLMGAGQQNSQAAAATRPIG